MLFVSSDQEYSPCDSSRISHTVVHHHPCLPAVSPQCIREERKFISFVAPYFFFLFFLYDNHSYFVYQVF